MIHHLKQGKRFIFFLLSTSLVFFIIFFTFIHVSGAVEALSKTEANEQFVSPYSEIAGLELNSLLPIEELAETTVPEATQVKDIAKDLIHTIIEEEKEKNPSLSNELLTVIEKDKNLEETIVTYLDEIIKGERYPDISTDLLERKMTEDVRKKIDTKIVNGIKKVNDNLKEIETSVPLKDTLKETIKDTTKEVMKEKDPIQPIEDLVDNKENENIPEDKKVHDKEEQVEEGRENETSELEESKNERIDEGGILGKVIEEEGSKKSPEEELGIKSLEERKGPFPNQKQLGGFVIETPVILQGKAFDLTSVNRETSTQGNAQLGSIKLDDVIMDGLTLYRNIDVKHPYNISITGNGQVAVNGSGSSRDLRVDVSEMYAETLRAKVLLDLVPITLKRQWYMDVEEELLPNLASLAKANIEGEVFYFNTHYLFADTIVIPNMNLSVQPGFSSTFVD